jgi:hypothetical protein
MNMNLMCFIFDTLKTWKECFSVDGGDLFNMFSWSTTLCVIVVLLAILIVACFGKVKRLKGVSLIVPFASVWCLGFVVYDIGMYTGDKWSLIGNFPMAIIHAFGMFVMESDVSAIHEPFHNNAWFMFFFSISHFVAAVISMLFIIKYFGFNIVEGIKRSIARSWFGRTKDVTYIFWGMNNATYHLSKSINKFYREENIEKKTSYRIIIIRSSRDRNTSISINGIDRLFNFISSNDNDVEEIRDIDNCITTNTFVNLSELDVSSLGKPANVFRALGLKSVSKLIEKKTKGDVHVFFLSEDESANIKSVANLRQDMVFAKEALKEYKVKFYCHARYNSVNRVIEDWDAANNIEVQIIDSSHLSIECLKRDDSFQPISYVDIDTTNNYGTVTSPFTSLVIGFGETGKDALRFLYEFGAFVDGNSANCTQRSIFNCHIVDRELDKTSGPIQNAAPNVFSAKNAISNQIGSESSPLVTMHAIDYNSNEFYNKLLCELAPIINYIVIAIGDDEAGMTLAVRILKYLRRQGRDFKKLRIFVRSYNSSLYPHINKIAKHYNENEERIVVFGNEEKLYTYSMIIEDEFEKHGKDYYESYRSLNPEHDEDGSWDQRRKKLKGLITLKKKQINPQTGCPVFEEETVANPAQPTLNNLQKLRRKETQDKANALHEATKMKILETVIPNWYTQLAPRIFNNPGENVIVKIKRKHLYDETPKKVKYYELGAKEQLLMDNLAKLEHLRWNASHEVLGYTPMPLSVKKDRGCNEALVTHNCLVAWEDLDAESDRIDYIKDYKIYDYGVVETTIDIYRRAKDSDKSK